ncbi:MAG: hypothetical protein OXE44_02840 [Nitrospinae bacterium]|nr:hypothetical protein [Nitrospinota bacterium]
MTVLIRSLHFALLVSWLALTLGVWWAATNSFDTFDAQKNPVASKLFEPASTTKLKGRMAAREVNARIFEAWNRLQIVFCLLLFYFIWRAGRMSVASLVLAGCLLLIVGTHVFWFSPKIEALGRILTSAEASAGAPAVQSEFGRYHGAYVISDVLKACLLAAAIWMSPWRRTARSEPSRG